MTRLIFVYGTLKQGFSRNNILTEMGAKFITNGNAMRTVCIDTHGRYPHMVQADDYQHTTYGEIWELPDDVTLDRLNAIECPAGYVPQLIDVSASNGDYLMNVVSYMMMGIFYDGKNIRSLTTLNTVKGVTDIWKGVMWQDIGKFDKNWENNNDELVKKYPSGEELAVAQMFGCAYGA